MLDVKLLSPKEDDVIIIKYDIDNYDPDSIETIGKQLMDTFPKHIIINIPNDMDVYAEDKMEFIGQLLREIEFGQM